MVGTLGSLQFMDQNLNVEMGSTGTGEQVKSFCTGAALRVCSSRASPPGQAKLVAFEVMHVQEPGARENHPWRLFMLVQGCLKAWHPGSNTELLPSSPPQNSAVITPGSLAATSWLRESPAFLQP